MKNTFVMLMAIMCVIFMMSGCQKIDPDSLQESVPQLNVTIPTTNPITEPVESKPEHSDLYVPGLPVEDVILYFNEVCLDAEFVNSGDSSRLQKWTVPIYYQINGDPTPDDMTILENFINWLNTVDGFPGMYESADNFQTNMRIYFCSQEELLNRMGANFVDMDGAVTFWYENDEIYDCMICYRTDLTQYLRNSVILEEIYNGLGPIQDTDLREDSIIYSGFSEPQCLTEADELLLKLLYHPNMKCGLQAGECEVIIRGLYY